jgi:hypothetical protein
MRNLFSGRRPSPSLVISIAALVVALAGTAVALPGKKLIDKNDLKKNVVKTKTIKNSAVTRAKQARDQRTDWAVVAADDTIQAQSGGITVIEHTSGSGGYHMRFPVQLGQRPIAATIHGGGAVTGQISATRCGTSPPGGENCSFGNNQQHIFVKTTDSGGTGADRRFIVTVLPK